MSGIRKRHGREFKVQVVLEALCGKKPMSQLSSDYGVHATQIKEWKAQGLEAMRERCVAVVASRRA